MNITRWNLICMRMNTTGHFGLNLWVTFTQPALNEIPSDMFGRADANAVCDKQTRRRWRCPVESTTSGRRTGRWWKGRRWVWSARRRPPILRSSLRRRGGWGTECWCKTVAGLSSCNSLIEHTPAVIRAAPLIRWRRLANCRATSPALQPSDCKWCVSQIASGNNSAVKIICVRFCCLVHKIYVNVALVITCASRY